MFQSSSKNPRNRSRCYSSMNYDEYQCFFGTPPRMPKAPNPKPIEDPDDIPDMMLEQPLTNQSRSLPKQKVLRTIKYKMEPIPEIQGSDANSLQFQSPRLNCEFSLVRTNSKLEDQGADLQTIQLGPRKRNRPRSYSENSPLNHKIRIIDFLAKGGKQGQEGGQTRKMVKLQ